MQRAAIVANPLKLRRPDEIRAAIEQVFSAQGWAPPLWLETTVDDSGEGQARAALAEGVDLVCPLGGDGTVRCVAAALRGTDTPMGLLPAGTGNLLARNLRVPVRRRHARAVERLLTGSDRQIDVGVARIGDDSGADSDREHVFTVMAGLGLEADMLGGTPERLKARLGWMAYVVAGLRHLRARPVGTTLVADTAEPVTGPTTTVIVGNCGTLTGGVRLMPAAQPDDGRLDVVVLAAGTFPAWGRLVAQVLRRRSNDVQVRHLTAHEVTITTDQARSVELDGDLLGPSRSLSIRVDPQALRIRIP